jgi:hypothetical protein
VRASFSYQSVLSLAFWLGSWIAHIAQENHEDDLSDESVLAMERVVGVSLLRGAQAWTFDSKGLGE